MDTETMKNVEELIDFISNNTFFILGIVKSTKDKNLKKEKS